MKQGADWLAWCLQFIAGLFIGALVGGRISAGGRSFGAHGWWMAPNLVPFVIGGMALLGAGLASFYGDCLWLGLSYRVIPPDGIRHSQVSRRLSIASVVLGGILAFAAILRHFRAF